MATSKPSKLIRKAFPVKVTNIDEAEGIVEAIVSVFGIIDHGDDIVHAGAFSKTIIERSRHFQVLDNHQMNSTRDVVGTIVGIKEVRREELPSDLQNQYPEATGGLWVKVQFLMDTDEGAGVFKRIKGGAIREYSFGFDIIQSDRTKSTRDGETVIVRNLREVRLWEISPVIWGMNPATATVGAKDLEAAKEMTPDGPQKRLGDILIAAVYRTFTNKIGWFLEDGILSAGEWLLLNQVATDFINTLQAEIPEDVMLRPIGRPGMYDDFYYLFGGKDPAERKDDVNSASEGEPDAAENTDDVPNAGSQPQDTAPTQDEPDEMLSRIEVERMRNQLVLDQMEIAS